MTYVHDDFWGSEDPLGQALHFLRMDGMFYCHSDLSCPWGFEMPEIPRSLMFHVVLSGEGLLSVDGEEWVSLKRGDLALVPHGRGHFMADTAETETQPILELEREHVSARYERLVHGGEGARTLMICGAVQFRHPAAFELVRLLPGVIRIRDWPERERAWIESTLALMAEEASGARPGGETVMTRLADILVIQAIRAWITGESNQPHGWLRGVQDPQIGRAIASIHRDPGNDWTVAKLARNAGMSRSGFAARFTELLDDTPARYLTRWRMHLATYRLRESNEDIGELAEQLGYSSLASFSRAYKAWTGVPPSAARNENVEWSATSAS